MSLPAIFDRELEFDFHDDFFENNTTRWTSIDDGATGTNAISNTNGGWLNVVTAGANNDYHMNVTAAKSFAFSTTKNLVFQSRIALTEAATNVASWICGLTDTTTTGGLQSGTSGPLASFQGAIFYKISGTQLIKFMVSTGSTQSVNSTTWTFTSGTTYNLRFEFSKGDGTNGKIIPYVNDSPGAAMTIPLSSYTGLMYAIYGVKAGSSSAETFSIDLINIRGQR